MVDLVQANVEHSLHHCVKLNRKQWLCIRPDCFHLHRVRLLDRYPHSIPFIPTDDRKVLCKSTFDSDIISHPITMVMRLAFGTCWMSGAVTAPNDCLTNGHSHNAEVVGSH